MADGENRNPRRPTTFLRAEEQKTPLREHDKRIASVDRAIAELDRIAKMTDEPSRADASR